MKTATVEITLDKIGQSVTKKNVTPAELMLLVSMHHMNAGGNPVKELKENEEEVERSDYQEKTRLAGFYGAKRVEKFYPGSIPNFPKDFDEAKQAGVKSSAPVERLLTVGEEGGVS